MDHQKSSVCLTTSPVHPSTSAVRHPRVSQDVVEVQKGKLIHYSDGGQRIVNLETREFDRSGIYLGHLSGLSFTLFRMENRLQQTGCLLAALVVASWTFRQSQSGRIGQAFPSQASLRSKILPLELT